MTVKRKSETSKEKPAQKKPSAKKPVKKPAKKAAPKKRRLTKKQEQFVEAMADPSVKTATEAAERSGTPKRSARTAAYRMLTNNDILAAIEKRKAELAELAQLKPETILGAACAQAFGFTIKDCLNDKGYFDIEKANATGAIHFVKSISRTPGKFGESVRFEMYSAETARQELAEYLGMKQKPRENDEKLKRVAEAITAYLEQEPDADRQQIIDIFAKRHALDVGLIEERLESIH